MSDTHRDAKLAALWGETIGEAYFRLHYRIDGASLVDRHILARAPELWKWTRNTDDWLYERVLKEDCDVTEMYTPLQDIMDAYLREHTLHRQEGDVCGYGLPLNLIHMAKSDQRWESWFWNLDEECPTSSRLQKCLDDWST